MKRLIVTVAIALTAVLLPSPAATARTTPSARVPDLGMAPLRDFQMDTSTGRRLLRFTAEIVNVGTGPFELRGRRSATGTEMSVMQRIVNADGTKSMRPTGASMIYAGDDHNHWHVKDLERYTIHPVDGDRELGRGAKAGFCFSDNAAYRLALPRAPRSPAYRSCGLPGSTMVTMGLSVGWGDVYGWNLAWQWIDVSALSPGDYVVRARADPKAIFTEADTSNNTTWTKIRIAATNEITVLEQGPAA